MFDVTLQELFLVSLFWTLVILTAAGVLTLLLCFRQHLRAYLFLVLGAYISINLLAAILLFLLLR